MAGTGEECSGGGTSNGGVNRSEPGSVAAVRPSVWSTLRNWETPAAYRTRLRVAFLLVIFGLIARWMNGGRLAIHRFYSWGTSFGDSFGFTIVYGPNLVFLLLSLLIRFMLHRPQLENEDEDDTPPPPPPARVPTTITSSNLTTYTNEQVQTQTQTDVHEHEE